MPAPKAVLRDIADFNLDPRVPYTATDDKSGRLITSNTKAHTGLHLNQGRILTPQNALKELPKEEEKVVVVKKSKLAAAAPAPAPEPVVAAEAVKPVEKPTDEKPVEVKVEAKSDEEKPVS